MFDEFHSLFVDFDCFLEILDTFDGDLTDLGLCVSDQIAEAEVLIDLVVKLLVVFWGYLRTEGIVGFEHGNLLS